MTATNHALTGAIIGLAIHQPLLAITLAFLSHYVLDSLPHYGGGRLKIGSRNFTRYLWVDGSLCVVLVALLTVLHPEHWLLACVCAFLATSSDFMWTEGYLRARNGGKYRVPTYTLARFHGAIQWFQRPIGAVVELTWLVGATVLLAKLV